MSDSKQDQDPGQVEHLELTLPPVEGESLENDGDDTPNGGM